MTTNKFDDTMTVEDARRCLKMIIDRAEYCQHVIGDPLVDQENRERGCPLCRGIKFSITEIKELSQQLLAASSEEEPQEIPVEDTAIYIKSTGNPVEDLKWVVNVLHKEMPPIEVLGAMLCHVIDMLEGKHPEILSKKVGTTKDTTLGYAIKGNDWH